MKIFQPQGIPPAFSTHSRASTATYIDDAGVLQTAASNVLRFQGGLPLVEGAATNYAINNNSSTPFKYTSGGADGTIAVVVDPFWGLVLRITKTVGSAGARVGARWSVGAVTGSSFAAAIWIRRPASVTGGMAVYCDMTKSGGGFRTASLALNSIAADTFVRASSSNSEVGASFVSGNVYAWVDGAVGDYIDVALPCVWPGLSDSSAIVTAATPVTRAADVFTASGTDLTGGTGPAGGVLYTTATAYWGTWFATSYSPGGTRVVYKGSLWELLADQSPAGPTDVPGVSPKWARVGPENRLAAFDGEINSRTYSHPLAASRTHTVSTIVALGAAADALLLADIDDAATVTVRIAESLTGATLLQQTIEPSAGASRVRSQYLITGFSAPSTAVLFIGISGPVNVAKPGIGLIAWGQTQDLGCTEWGPRAGIRDYSRKEPDDFGQVIFVRRAFAKTVSTTLQVDKADINTVHDRLNNLRATPAVWILSDDADYAVPLVVYGFYRDFYTTFPRLNDIQCALEIEGLT